MVAVLCSALVVLGLDVTVAAARLGDRPGGGAAAAQPAPAAPPSRTATASAAAPATPVPDPPTTVPAAPPGPPIPSPADAPVSPAWTLRPYEGLGVWLDVYDWTDQFTNGHPHLQPADVDHMAEMGVQTLFIQTGHRRSPTDVIEQDRLLQFIDRAHADGIAVVGWYLPMLDDTSVDLRRLLAAAALPVDGLGVDIESLSVADPAERTRRLLELSAGLRRDMGDKTIAAITPDAVQLQVVNPRFWPGFPWPEIGSTYNVILPMAYWSVRKPEWRWGEKYAGENIDRIRAATGRPDMPIHVIGGIADGVSLNDLIGMVRAVLDHRVLGGSLYDWGTSHADQWAILRGLRMSR